jgi:BlaI family transcriptional regulator, penicillinase repressor
VWTTVVVVANDSLTDLQLAVMKAVWRLGDATVGDVAEALAAEGKELAPTTVATLLDRLGKQGWLNARKKGRQLVYRAKVKEEDAARGMLNRLVRSFFAGKVSRLTAQLLESEELSAAELKELRSLLDEKGG